MLLVIELVGIQHLMHKMWIQNDSKLDAIVCHQCAVFSGLTRETWNSIKVKPSLTRTRCHWHKNYLLFNTQSYNSINLSTFLTSPFLPDSILSSRGMIVSGSEVPFENSFPGNSWCEKFVNSELICIDSSGCRCMTVKGGLI